MTYALYVLSRRYITAINDSLLFITAELHKQTKPLANLQDAADKSLLGRTFKLLNNQNLSLNGQETSSILTDISALENLLKTNPTDPHEQELKKYLTSTSNTAAVAATETQKANKAAKKK